MMNFLAQFFEKHGTRGPRQHDEHGRHTARPRRDPSHDEPRYAYAPGHDHGEHHGHYDGAHGRSGLHGGLGVLAQHKAIRVVAALLPAARLGELPRLVNTFLVDVPKAVLDDLAPLLQLKSTLEGKA